MKQLLSLAQVAVIFIFSGSFKISNGDKNLKVDNNRVEVKFNNQFDFGDIVKIKLDMAKRGIVLDYKKLQFTESGKLKAIDFSVTLKMFLPGLQQRMIR